MESDLAAISCLIVLGVMLTCACSYLCTEAYSLIVGTGRPSHRLPRPRYSRRNTTYSTDTAVRTSPIACTVSPQTPTLNLATATQNVSTSTTTVLTEREIVRTETQRQHLVPVQPQVPPPPLPPRATILTPWTLVPTHSLSRGNGRASQLITLRRERDEDENFQLPPRPVSMAVHFRNQVSSQAYPNPHTIRGLGNTTRPRIAVSTSSRPSNASYRQTIAALGNFGFGHAIWFPEHVPDDCEIDLPPTYEEAMEMRLQVEDSPVPNESE